MLNRWMNTVVLVGLFSCTCLGHSQALPTATATGALQVGVGWTYVKPDFGPKAIQGVTIFGDFDLRPHFGVEAEYHYIALNTPTDFAEESFFIGPRFILPRGRFHLYAKALVGVGDYVVQNPLDNRGALPGNYFAYGIGGGVDYRVTRHIVARGDFEYQHWSYPGGLTPTAVTAGVAYRFR